MRAWGRPRCGWLWVREFGVRDGQWVMGNKVGNEGCQDWQRWVGASTAARGPRLKGWGWGDSLRQGWGGGCVRARGTQPHPLPAAAAECFPPRPCSFSCTPVPLPRQDPVDLSLIRQRLQGEDYYFNLDIFAADFRRMFANCK